MLRPVIRINRGSKIALNTLYKPTQETGVLTIPIEIPEVGIKYGYLYNGYIVNEEISSSPDWGFMTYESLDDMMMNISLYTVEEEFIGTGYFGNYLKGLRVDPDPHPRWNYNATHIPLDTLNLSLYPGGRRRGNNGNFESLGSNSFTLMANNFNMSIVTTGANSDYVILIEVNNNWGHSVRLSRLATHEENTSLSMGDRGPDYIGNDGKIYKTVYIESYIIMSENLAETKYRNGSDIPLVIDSGDWIALTSAARCAYDNNEYYV